MRPMTAVIALLALLAAAPVLAANSLRAGDVTVHFNALPSTTLQIHYRSAYRELIGFSNAAFYGNRLNVPVRHPRSSIARIKPLELIQVDGVYQHQSNPAEAARVVEYLAQLWQHPYAARPSVGVVTFNRKQAELIEEHLEQRAGQIAPQPACVTGPRQGVPCATITQGLPRSLQKTVAPSMAL